MPKPGMRWRHVVLGTHNSWLPGDPRGFRSKHHKIHSSGDYKNPPPPGEHAGLLRHSKEISGDPVVIPPEARPAVGNARIARLRKLGYSVLAVSVSGMHAHLQVELPDDMPAIRAIIGQCKSAASHAIREVLPGRVWARDGGYKGIDSPEYQDNVFRYILNQEGAWTWSYKDELSEEPRRLEDSPAGLESESKPRGESSGPAGPPPDPISTYDDKPS